MSVDIKRVFTSIGVGIFGVVGCLLIVGALVAIGGGILYLLINAPMSLVTLAICWWVGSFAWDEYHHPKYYWKNSANPFWVNPKPDYTKHILV